MEEQQAENIRKMFMAMAEDVRVVVIKLADRLHNMRTLQFLSEDKQLRIARQTMEIYAPLAHRLGMWQIKWELEDLSFKYLEPDIYRKLADLLTDRRRARESFINKSIGILRKELGKVGIEAEISGRPKHLYSIYKKMERKGAEFSEIYDLHAIRLLVHDVKDCYAALGVVHSIWRPIPGQFDDYIAMPKANMYQSLHTAVIGPDAKPVEVQIRTHHMHEVAEAGIAAHWRYKEGSRGDRRYDEKLAWVRQLIEWQREVADATEFVEGLKLDLFQDQVFVFTPKGDVKDLPAGAGPLDFAYRIHTDVGHRTIGAKVNNRLVPLDYKLRNGDIVEIITTKAAHGPSRDWLNIVRTNQAREKIRQWFKRQQRDENVTQGKDILDRELRRLAHETLATIDGEKLIEIASQLHYRELDDFYAAIGYGAVSPASVVSKLEVHDDVAIALPEIAPPAEPSTSGVRVKGVGDLLVRFAKCCSPIPGDPIMGYVTRGKGVTIHRADLPVGPLRAGHRAADRRRVGGGRAADLPDHRADRGDRPPGAAQRDHQRRRRAQGEHRGGQHRDPPRRDGDHHRHPQGHEPAAAVPGPVPDRAGQGRHQRHPRGELSHRRRPGRPRARPAGERRYTARMARPIAAPRGTRDLLPEEARRWSVAEARPSDLAERYGFERIDTPLFERVDLFARGLGDSSDAVEKEMFRVSGAKGSEEERAEWALRPEPTAGIVRAYIEHGMQVLPGPLRLWMLGPMFRYDRPQAGRYRQFVQWDVEVIGDPGPMVDAELVELAQRYFAGVGLRDVVAHLNSIGDAQCRPAFRAALVDYFTSHEARLGEDSRRRLRVNPLRVLDDKTLDPELAAGAPRSTDFLCDPCREHFASVTALLDGMGIRYVLDHRLVRGLDYYTRTTFEFFVAGREGQQQALGGGGRYDGLVEHLGGPANPRHRLRHRDRPYGARGGGAGGATSGARRRWLR